MSQRRHVAVNRSPEWWPHFVETVRGVGESVANLFSPPADAAGSDSRYMITLELPGVAEDEIEITLNDNLLTIEGEKRSHREESGDRYFLAERTYGAFHRSFRLPDDADADGVSATHQHGVLMVSIPKVEANRGQPRHIKVTAG